MRRSLFLGVFSLVILLLAVSCIKRREAGRPRDGLEQLLTWMNGSFSSRAEALEDTSYFDARLEIVPIWTDRPDGYWVYVEQAVADDLGRPYRQQVYHLAQLDDSTFAASIYELPRARRFVGQWRDPDAFSELTADSLTKCEGCTVYLHEEDDTAFTGHTIKGDCPSDRLGAVYATTDMRITSGYLYIWDRGFDSAGAQVWGEMKRGYLFEKLRNP
jgi:CpeT protein